MCDAVVVVETGVRGGSLLTVSNAVDYGKKIFAVPGRLTDPLSRGCNKLIAEGTANPFFDRAQFLKEMQWDHNPGIAQSTQPGLFKTPAPQTPAAPTNISPEADLILALLSQHSELPFEKLTTLTSLPANALSMPLFQLELRGIIQALPGKRFRINRLQ
jgi:DNA processing protein